MRHPEHNLIYHLHPASEEDIAKFNEQSQQVEYGLLIFGLFMQYSSPKSRYCGRDVIVGNLKDEKIFGCMQLSFHQQVLLGNARDMRLSFKTGTAGSIPAEGSGNVFVRELLEISSIDQPQGEWSASGGNSMKRVISVNLREFWIPSTYGRWVLQLLADFAMTASEHFDPLKEKPSFWDGPSDFNKN